jgi:RNA polymerase sigma-70 factor (ECF subfamily)
MAVVGSFDEVYATEYPRLVQALSVAEAAADAEDAVQDAFVAAQRRWSYVSGLEDPAGWVRRVALNRLSNGRRNRHRRSASPSPTIL